MWKFVFSCVAIVLFSVATRAQELSAAEVLGRVASAYSAGRTYADEGSVETVIGNSPVRQFNFRTAFVRPANFRFELLPNRADRTAEDSYIVWKEGEVSRSWTPFGIGQRETPLDTSLIRMATISAGTSIVVPQLLLPGLFRPADLLASLGELKFNGEEKIDGRQTLRIEGTFQGQKVKLWIDKSECLIVKLYRRASLGSTKSESTTRYKPRLNSDIPHENLAFRPGAKNQPALNAPPTNTLTSSTAANHPALTARPRGFGFSISDPATGSATRAIATPASDDDVVRVDTDLVICAVLVLDQQGRIVRDLKKEDFIVKEDDRLQEVGTFSLGDNRDIPRSIVLIIDYSGSQLPYIRTSIEAAKTLVDKLNPKDRMAVVTDDVQLLVDFTSDKDLLKSQLEALKTRAISGVVGASDQYDALMATLNELFDEEDVRPIIIFQTDGDELDSLKGAASTDPYVLPRRYTFQNILTASEKARATVYSIIPGVQLAGFTKEQVLSRARLDWSNRQAADIELFKARKQIVPNFATATPTDAFFVQYSERWMRMQLALVGLAKYTGAWAEFLEQPGQADEIYTRVLTDIDRRYILGYYPTNRARDGTRRRINIEVKGHPEYRVWGQKTYFAQDSQ